MSREKLIRMALLLGSDYTEGIRFVPQRLYYPQLDRCTYQLLFHIQEG